MLNCKTLSTQAAGIKHLYTLNDVKEITIVQSWQNSIKNSVFWKGAEFLLREHKRMIISKITASIALCNSAEYAITTTLFLLGS
jgi:hypothetical protein